MLDMHPCLADCWKEGRDVALSGGGAESNRYNPTSKMWGAWCVGFKYGQNCIVQGMVQKRRDTMFDINSEQN